jgi:hypothetical protein
MEGASSRKGCYGHYGPGYNIWEYGNVKNVVSNRSVSHREEKYGNVMYEDVSY